jgi:hypothetical protein
MIKNQSDQTAGGLEQKVKLDITEKGWVVSEPIMPTSYDLIVDMGIVDGKREFVTMDCGRIVGNSG